MNVALHRKCYFLSALFAVMAVSPAAHSPAASPVEKPNAKYADPKATYRTYIEAVRNCDVKAAKDCWAIDDDNKSGALDTIVGVWISTRKFKQVAEKKFGAKSIDAIVKERDDLSDAALDLTKQRLDDADIKFTGDVAALTIKWRGDDGYPNPAFEFSKEPTSFRNLGGNWKIDANKQTGLKRGADFFEKGTWGPIFRDHVIVLNESIDAMENGKLKSVEELGDFVKRKIEAMQKQYVKEREAEERNKESPKSK